MQPGKHAALVKCEILILNEDPHQYKFKSASYYHEWNGKLMYIIFQSAIFVSVWSMTNKFCG